MLSPIRFATRGGRRTFAITGRGRREERAPDPSRPTIAIIGGGFSGTLCALHLLRRCPRSRVLLIERNRQFGRGLAYSTGNPGHLLNVPAAKMSAFHDRPNDFVAWLETQGETGPEGAPWDGGSFVPRRLFGAYVRHLLNAEFKNGDASRLELLHGEVQSIDDGEHLVLALDRGRSVTAHLAIVAVGNFPPEPPRVADPWIYETPLYRGDPWGHDTLAELDPEAAILLVGTGLTMVDTAMSLLNSGHRGKIFALSRRGLLPRCHATQSETAEFTPNALPSRVSALTKTIRQQIAEAEAQGIAWQAIIDALRPTMQGIWDSLSAAERGRFLRHIRPWWEVHRHRMAPAIAARIEEAQERGQLSIIRGRISAYRPVPRGAQVEFRRATAKATEAIEVARIVNCSGPACDFERIRNPLIQGLLENGRARPDPFRLGLDLTPQGALKAADGAISQRLYAIGPLTKGLFWEMTSVPDIRRQCELVATHLAQVVASRRFARLDAIA